MAKHHTDSQAIELTSKKMIELKLCKVAHFKEILKTKSYMDPAGNTIPLFPPDHKNLRGKHFYQDNLSLQGEWPCTNNSSTKSLS